MVRADIDQVVEIEQSLTGAPHWSRSAYMTAVDPHAVPRRIALVAEAPGGDEPRQSVLAGFAVASLLPPQAELETIAVAAQFQRRGLAGQLFSVLVDELRAVRITDLTLEVRASNQPALGLYGRAGFLEIARRRRYYHDPVEDAVLMHLGF
jgi:ribosomal-protein-alanine N-acetyltransferase